MPKLSSNVYANVVATIALFLALTGGAAYAANQLGKNAVKSKNIAPKAVKNKHIAPNAVKEKQIAKNAVTTTKVKAKSISREKLSDGALSGLPVLDATAASVPGLNTDVSLGVPVPLAGTASFTPKAGKSYLLMSSVKGAPVDADGANGSIYGGNSCYIYFDVMVNGLTVAGLRISANADQAAPYNIIGTDGATSTVGSIDPGVQTVSVSSYGSTRCGATSTAALRFTVIELG